MNLNVVNSFCLSFFICFPLIIKWCYISLSKLLHFAGWGVCHMDRHWKDGRFNSWSHGTCCRKCCCCLDVHVGEVQTESQLPDRYLYRIHCGLCRSKFFRIVTLSWKLVNSGQIYMLNVSTPRKCDQTR